MAERDRERHIIYAFVTRGPRVRLAEYTGAYGNFQQVSHTVLQRLESSHLPHSGQQGFVYGEFAFHYIVDEGGIWYVCMSDKDMGRRLPLGFLQAMREQFLQRYTVEEAQTAIAYGMQKGFSEEIRCLMERFNDPEVDRIGALTAKVRGISETLTESIDGLLERQEKIELLVDRSEVLSSSAGVFAREAKRVSDTTRWRRRRSLLMLSGVLALFLLYLLWENCLLLSRGC